MSALNPELTLQCAPETACTPERESKARERHLKLHGQGFRDITFHGALALGVRVCHGDDHSYESRTYGSGAVYALTRHSYEPSSNYVKAVVVWDAPEPLTGRVVSTLEDCNIHVVGRRETA